MPSICNYQVEKIQEEAAADYLRYRDEADARKLLISDMNDLRNQQEDMVMSQQAMDDNGEEKEDPITLKIALKWVWRTATIMLQYHPYNPYICLVIPIFLQNIVTFDISMPLTYN